MSKILRKSLVFVFALCLLFTVGLSIAMSSPKALALGTLSAYADDLTMVEGASIYSKYEYGSTLESSKTRGIRFGMTMPKADYDNLLAKASEQGVTVNFGMFIKPNGTAYKYELSQANLFDNGALYYWEDNKLDAKDNYLTKNPTTGTPLYNDNGVYWNAEIYNISNPEIEVKGDVVYLYGFLVGFDGASAITRDYTCRGYVSLTKGESVTNVLANYSKELGRAPATSIEERNAREGIVSRSMAHVAQGVIEKNPTNSTLISQLENRYLNTEVQNVTTKYTVNYYLDGVKKDTKVLEGKVYTNLNADDFVYDASYGYNCDKNLVTLSNADEINATKTMASNKTVVDALFITNHDFDNVTTYLSDAEGHWKECECGVTSTKVSHFGGTATFTSLATCQACNVEYGEKLKFTAEETDFNRQMFTPKNDLYKVNVNSNTDFITEGSTSFKFTATQRWPEWYFSSTFLTWLNDNGYRYISFKIYFDLANAGTGFTSGATGYINGLAGTDCATDKWLMVSTKVSSLTATTQLFYLNKAAEATFNVYIDDVEFFKSGEFTGEEQIVDLEMFALSGNASIALNTNSSFITEGDTSLRLYSPSRWPKYTFTQTFVNWLKTNGYTTLSFDYYIDVANSTTYVSKLQGIISNTAANRTGDTWIPFSVSVSSLTSSKYIQFDRPATGTLSVYLDNIQFIK